MEAMLIHLYWLVPLILVIVLHKLVLRLFGVIVIPENTLGIVNKKFVLVGSNKTLPDGKVIALNGEAGWQADPLAPGVHYFKWPWQYEIKLQPFIQIPKGEIGIIEARDGEPLPVDRVLGKKVDCDTFQSARMFLANGGQRGPQGAIVPPGLWRINTAVFLMKTELVKEIPDNKVGIVTVKDGKPLSKDEIAGQIIDGHNSFQDVDAFINGGGSKGLQEQVILAGRYFLNPGFATVEVVEMRDVPIAHVGVVIAYVGEAGQDLTGDGFKHGNLVEKGYRGVWKDPLDPGRYPINPYTHEVVIVPTQNVVLNWANEKSEAHQLDANLSSITVRSSDGFAFNLDVSQIIHIPRDHASMVIAQFGNIENLVTQVLEPIIGNYFRNSAQSSNVITFLTERQKRQEEAKEKIVEALKEYNVGAVDTLIGDIVPPEELMKPLKDKQVAEQEKTAYGVQREAEDERQKLEQSKAMANTQKEVVTAQRSVSIEEYNATAAIKKAEGQAGAKKTNAEADAKVLELVGNATAVKTLAIGKAEAEVIKQKIDSMEAGNYALVLVAEKLAGAGIPLVPQIMVNGGGVDGSRGTLVDVLLANQIQKGLDNTGTKKVSPQAAHLEKAAEESSAGTTDTTVAVGTKDKE